MEKAGGEYAEKDTNDYYAFHATAKNYPEIKPGKYLVDKDGVFRYYIDPPINGRIAVTVTTSKSYTAVDESKKNAALINADFIRSAPQETHQGKSYAQLELQDNSIPGFSAGRYLVDVSGYIRFAQTLTTENLRLRDSEVADANNSTNGIAPYDARKHA